jgi:lysophospholipid acyltransferase (LPLAT)-like uncharacterized protein
MKFIGTDSGAQAQSYIDRQFVDTANSCADPHPKGSGVGGSRAVHRLRHMLSVMRLLRNFQSPGPHPGIIVTDQDGKKIDPGVKDRRSDRSQRHMSAGRRLYYFLGMPLLRGLLYVVTATYRVERVIGKEIVARIIADKDGIYAPCYWHQHHILCSTMLHDWITQGFRACFLVSASVDGEVPARIARAWGAAVIRGSANRTGALALRDMQQKMKDGYSIVTTADGPNGPKYEFKPGAVLMARIGGVPMVPVACAAQSAWYLKRWDDFMIPRPFSKVVLAVGEPVTVPKNTPLDELEEYRLQMQYATNALMAESKMALQKVTSK